MVAKIKTIITTMLVALLVVACSNDEQELFGQARKAPTPTPTEKTPVYVDIVDGDTILLDEDGNRVSPRPERVVIALKAVPDTAKAAGREAWTLLESEAKANPKTPAYEGLGGSTSWGYNHGTVAVEYSVYALYKGRKLPLWKPERLKEKQEHLRTETDGSTYSISDVRYSLLLGAQALATTPEVLMTKVGYVDEFLGIKVLRQSHQFGSGVYDVTTGVLTCLDSLFVAELWTSGYKNEQVLLVHMQNHILVSTSGQIVADLSKTVGQAWQGNKANLGGFIITETWQSKNTRESKLEATMNGQNYNFIDSVHVCKWTPNGGKVETAKKVRLDFAREGEPEDKCSAYLDVNIIQKDVKEVNFLKAIHVLFPKEAEVNTTNKTIDVNHKDRAFFELIYNDNTSGKDSVNYNVDHLFSYSVVGYLPAELKGKTVDIDAQGNVKYNGKVIMTITLKSRTVKDLTYRGKDYTDKAAKCDLTPKKAFFGENEITVTLSHDSENVTGKIPATYNSVKSYKVVGNPHHKSWNSVTGSYELTCNNYVTVVEIMMDDTEGNTFDLDYISYNYWVASGKIVAEVEDLSAVIGVPVAISSDGSVTIAGSSMTFSHSMKADKVTKGTWSYQPAACEAVAKTLTPISATQGRVDVYHGSAKVGSFIVPISLTEKQKPSTPDFPGRIIWGGATDSYVDGANVATWEGTYMHFVVENNGAYKVYSRKVGTNGWSSTDVSAAYVATISNSRAVAYIGNTVAGYSLGSCSWADQGSWTKIVYFDYNGGVARVISEISKTIGGESSNNCRMPLRGTWANGKITVDGTTYVVTGSQN